MTHRQELAFALTIIFHRRDDGKIFDRKEISDFVRLAETLLSPIPLGQTLPQEEHRVVDF
jgi:hypothetical protein